MSVGGNIHCDSVVIFANSNKFKCVLNIEYSTVKKSSFDAPG